MIAARPLWQRLRRPSLLGRLMLTLLASVVASFAVLLVLDWIQLERGGPGAHAVEPEARLLALSLPGGAQDTGPAPGMAEQEAAALAIVQAADRRFRHGRALAGWAMGPVLLRLDVLRPAAPARTLFASTPALAAQSPPNVGQDKLALDGQAYWIGVQTAGPWRVWLLDPVPGRGLLLRWLAADLLPSYLIALPLVLLPLGWAALTGLRPLRQLADTVRQRQPGDTSPLGAQPRHAELRPLADALDALAARTRQALDRERRFVQDAAHELRTPLAVIATRAHTLTHAHTPQERQQAQAAIEQAVARATHLGQQLLTLAVLEDGVAPSHAPQALDLVAVVQQALADAQPQADACGIELALDAPDTLPCRVEREALHRVLENLIGNALLHGHSGAGGQVLLTLQAHGHGGWQLRVADEGPGIAPEDRARLFQPFQRGRQVQARGSGLGLAIVQAAVQRLGGQIDIGPGLDGRGVAFALTVPGDSGGFTDHCG